MNDELNELRNITLEIRWSDYWSKREGKMCVHLYAFIQMHNITKFRKLLKLIRGSDTPDEEQKITEMFKMLSEQFEVFKKGARERQVFNKEKTVFCEKQVDILKYNRDRFKRNTPPYKHYAVLLKEQKKELSAVKAAYRQAVQEDKQIETDKKFINKCMEIMK